MKSGYDVICSLLEVVTALFLEMTGSEATCSEQRLMLLGMCGLCERSALSVEKTDAEAARLIRRTTELRGLAMRSAILAQVVDEAKFEAMWDQDSRDAIRHLSEMLLSHGNNTSRAL